MKYLFPLVLFFILIFAFIICYKPERKVFITFGAGSDDYIKAGQRLKSQADGLKLFDQSILYTNVDLKNDKLFWEKHGQFVELNKRGYGYWLWKPYIIKKQMDQMKDGDILLYLDSGCEIDIRHRDMMIRHFETVRRDLIIGLPTIFKEKQWTKMDLMVALDAMDSKYTDTPQRQGGIMMLYVCDRTRKLVDQWYEVACDYHLIDDSSSIRINDPTFIEHRHDQSIFSILTKKYDLYSNSHLVEPLIHSGRNRSGFSNIL
jgi:hypothetical protein